MLADPQAELAKALGVDFDASGMLGNVRSKRCALSSFMRDPVGMTQKQAACLIVRQMMAARARKHCGANHSNFLVKVREPIKALRCTAADEGADRLASEGCCSRTLRLHTVAYRGISALPRFRTPINQSHALLTTLTPRCAGTLLWLTTTP